MCKDFSRIYGEHGKTFTHKLRKACAMEIPWENDVNGLDAALGSKLSW